MTYQQAIKIYWREGSPQRLWSKAHTILARKCRMYGDKARRHTLWCCLMAEHWICISHAIVLCYQHGRWDSAYSRANLKERSNSGHHPL